MDYKHDIISIPKSILLAGIILYACLGAFAGKPNHVPFPINTPDSTVISSDVDSIAFSRRFIHRIGVEMRPSYIFPTHPFLQAENEDLSPIRYSHSSHIKYSFQFQPGCNAERIYGGSYQGIGLAHFYFRRQKELGSPIALYLFQGARITPLTSWLSLNYEWNFGLSFGWKPYNFETNSYNRVIGSKLNVYINTNFYLNWILSPRLNLNTGIALTHFSNGNTNYPNAGLNTIGIQLGLTYNFNKKQDFLSRPAFIPAFPRHISYDLVLFGSWRKKGISWGETQVASPDTYMVMGFNFAPMYNFGYKFRMGISLDGVYDGSANVYTEDYIYGTTQEFFTPSLHKQLALGISGRCEYVMPYFTVGVGMGVNLLHGGGDLKAFYQILALKTEITRNTFIHIGYNLKNFETPNFLMLGIGIRFHNKYPSCYRR